MGSAPHRVWRFAALAWAFMVSWVSGYALLPWRDVGIGGLLNEIMDGHTVVIAHLLLISARSSAVGAALLIFGVFAPLAVSIDYVVGGRTSRLQNMLLGAALAVPVFNILLWWSGTSMFQLLEHRPVNVSGFLSLPLAGMIVGLGVRHRKLVRPL